MNINFLAKVYLKYCNFNNLIMNSSTKAPIVIPSDLSIEELDPTNIDVKIQLHSKIFNRKNNIKIVTRFMGSSSFKRGVSYFLKDKSSFIGTCDVFNFYNRFYVLCNFGIIPSSRSKGLSEEFINLVKNDCYKKNILFIYLSVNPSNHIAIKTYTKCDFKYV